MGATSRSSSSHVFALMLKGDVLYAQDEWDNALEIYEMVAQKKSPDMSPAAMLAMGICYENLSQPEDAETTYSSILKDYPNSTFAEEARFQLAALLDRQEKPRKAIKIYRSINKDSPWASQAKERADWLEAPVTSLTLESKSTTS